MPSTKAPNASPAPEDAYTAEPFVPGRGGLQALRKAAADCRGCPLHREATQTVFGQGDTDARVLLVGEQPGDQEDRQGKPFVGPAGRLLDRALAEAGIDPEQTYVTNAVKHFKFTRSGPGKRRIHKAPSLREMTACGPWLAAELALVEPELIVVLGATAGKALLGPSFRVSKQRGMLLEEEIHGRPARVVATIHPSAALRADDREAVYQGLVADLKVAARALS
ncbi:UdgX family uracil-DNA binding protein [Streptomyces sporangiiformans]|uniref:Type-4 uracil-DNA glycosylase n=1 Tax=Streptomyces sporangiiformans TaxID=2315329 RepID=A0A505DG98_9ACTN|nr:UdgX family uracil-DNA binding protein [Streptomyces sporangiiformans]TPQ22097.1 UdgX family uracil-DNA binding protein [Streptomyces sporangiiformans]